MVESWRRLKSRLRVLWVPRGPGRLPVSNEIIVLILEMKRFNLGWGALRIFDELKLLGILLSKTAE